MTRAATDTDWLIPTAVITALAASFPLLMLPNYAGLMPAVGILQQWLLFAAGAGSVAAAVAFWRSGETRSLPAFRAWLTQRREAVGVLSWGVLLTGINMTAFMWTKPLLNKLVPFWADPLLLRVDHWLTGGHHPWRLLAGLNTEAAAWFYHVGWIVMLVATLVTVLLAAPSPRKTALLVTHSLLWSVVGPLIHCALPAGGPIFFARLGYGDHFHGLSDLSATGRVSDYLWSTYLTGTFSAGSGISAMPSLHIATTAWMLIALRVVAPRWLVPAGLAGGMIWLLSVALGWHYLTDGLVGGAAAWVCYSAVLRLTPGSGEAGRRGSGRLIPAV